MGSVMDIDRWYVSDYVNPANSGTYNYNDFFIITNMVPNNQWGDLSSGFRILPRETSMMISKLEILP